ncbi:MAG: hypothetical protein IT342_24465, partial [Candidatus Melainabacteria bacterium]|nr:hypothetical protein [Candidatus Melainabacteria bacterium]
MTKPVNRASQESEFKEQVDNASSPEKHIERPGDAGITTGSTEQSGPTGAPTRSIEKLQRPTLSVPPLTVPSKRRLRFDLNVFQMGLVLVGVPLLFEIIFVIGLFVAYKAAEAKTAEVEHTRNVRAVADRVLNGYAAASMSLLEFSFRRDQNSRMEYMHYRRHSTRYLER